MKILVTGAAGFIGHHLCLALLKGGNEVVGLDNFDPYYDRRAKEWNLDLIKKADSKDHFRFYKADIRDFPTLKEIFKKEKFAKVAHLAAKGGVPNSLKEPREYTDVNVIGTVNLLDLSARLKIANFVFASTSSIYGRTEKIPFVETDPTDRPPSPYSATKKAGEAFGWTYHDLWDLPVTILRYFGVYGPRQRPYGMVVQRFIKQVDHDQPMTIFGDGKMGRDYTYIDDIVAGTVAALDKDFPFEIINLGNSYPVTVSEVAATIKKVIGKGEITYVDKPPTEIPITYADISKAKKLLNYQPGWQFADGVAAQYEAYQKMPQWYKDLPW